jgi:hypothetical protein
MNDVFATASRLAAAGEEAVVDVGPVDLPLDDETLGALATARRDLLYGVPLRCRMAGPVSRSQAQVLAAAGVASVRLAPVEPDVLEWQRAFLQQLASVLRLHEVGIAPEWSVPYEATAAKAGPAIADLARALSHVPPPASGDEPTGNDLDATIDRWRDSHAPWRLTYARGPGFLRIYDRRAERERPAVIVLHGRQADVFLGFEEGSTLDQAAELAPEVPAEHLAGFVSALAANRLLLPGGGSFYLALPIRRKVEERWIERAYV